MGVYVFLILGKRELGIYMINTPEKCTFSSNLKQAQILSILNN